MKLVCFPYRWMPSTVFKNLACIYWDFKNGIENLIVFFEAVWRFRSCDYTGLLNLIQVSTHEMQKAQIHTVSADKIKKQLLIVETLCKRLIADDYFKNAGYDYETWVTLSEFEKRRIMDHEHYMSKQDVEYLGKLIRFVQHWWD